MSVYSKLNRPIIIMEYDPCWPTLYETEKARLTFLLRNRTIDIQHFGSTSIPGMCAKSVIDIAMGLEKLDDAAGCIPILESAGYSYEPELEAALPERRFLWQVDAEGQRYHIHLTSIHSPLWINTISFRDYLCQNPKSASEYGKLKKSLAGRYSPDIEAYVAGKTRFVNRILDLARTAIEAPEGSCSSRAANRGSF